ncbi:MAG TPA: hypothetical protein VFT49_03330 [Candidatus Saccharimonadales bacterium]|nr:hypothetical protein [Candidatus Saccharimonadales bacterium]
MSSNQLAILAILQLTLAYWAADRIGINTSNEISWILQTISWIFFTTAFVTSVVGIKKWRKNKFAKKRLVDHLANAANLIIVTVLITIVLFSVFFFYAMRDFTF